MKRNKMKMNIKLYSAIAFALTTSVGLAQPANEYFLESLPQSYFLNPAKTNQETFHMNFPAFFMAGQTSINASLPFAFSDIVQSQANGTTISLPAMVPLLKDNNYVNLNLQKEFLTYGWVKGKNYWSFNIGTTFNVDANFSKSFAELLVEGPGADDFLTGEPISLNGSKWNVTSFMEYGIGYSRDVNEKLRLGGRLRLLSGAMNFTGSLDSVSITTAADLTSLSVTSAIEAYSTSPLAYDETVTNGDTSKTLNTAQTQANFQSGLSGFGNVGVALDFGAQYKVSDNFSAFASIRDFGMISWKEGKKFSNKVDTKFSFEGFTVAQLQDSAYMDGFGDSIADILKLEETAESYTTYLPTRFFVGGEYSINEQFKANALYSGKIANDELSSTILAGIGWMPSKVFEVRLSYTIKNGTYDNVGFASVFTMGAWQLYFITDNILGLNAVDYAKNVNLSFGSNLSFGRKKYFENLGTKGSRVNKSGDEGVKSDSTSTDSTSSNPKMAPSLAPENSVKENVDAMEKVEEKAGKKADKRVEEAKDDAKKSDDKADDARDEARDDVKDAVKDAKKVEKKAENKATKEAKKAEDKAEKAIEAAEEKMNEADVKVKAAQEAAKQAKKQAAVAEKKAAAATTKAGKAPAAASPVTPATIAPAETPKESVDSLLIKPAVKKVETTATGAASTTAPKVDSTPKDINTSEGVKSLDKTIDALKQNGENKGSDVPSDIK